MLADCRNNKSACRLAGLQMRSLSPVSANILDLCDRDGVGSQVAHRILCQRSSFTQSTQEGAHVLQLGKKQVGEADITHNRVIFGGLVIEVHGRIV